MFKNLVRILSCVSIVGACGAAEQENDRGVENPIPLLMQKTSPNFLQEPSYQPIFQSFAESISEFEKNCKQTMGLPTFPEELTKMWNEKLTLLKDTSDILMEKRDVSKVHAELVEVTNDGFLAASEISIYGTEESDKLSLVLHDFWQYLWQARELTEYFHILSQKTIDPSQIPEICEAFDISVNYIRRFSIVENTPEEDEALKIEKFLNSILSAYEYMEFGKAMNTHKNLAFIEKIFSEDIKLQAIMKEPFFTA